MVDLINRVRICHHLPDDAVDGNKPSINSDLSMPAGIQCADLVTGKLRIVGSVLPSCGRAHLPNQGPGNGVVLENGTKLFRGRSR